MKITVIAIVVVFWACVAAGVWAEEPCTGKARQSGGHIGVYSDNPGFSDCELYEVLYATNSFYIVHVLLPEANTAQFMVVHNWDNAVVGSVDYYGNLQLGDMYTGVTVTYVGCKPLPHLLARLDFIPVSPTPDCTFVRVLPDPSLPSGQVEVVDCMSNVLHATGGYACVNTPQCCECGQVPEHCELPVATRETTWGAIKALYR